MLLIVAREQAAGYGPEYPYIRSIEIKVCKYYSSLIEDTQTLTKLSRLSLGSCLHFSLDTREEVGGGMGRFPTNGTRSITTAARVGTKIIGSLCAMSKEVLPEGRKTNSEIFVNFFLAEGCWLRAFSFSSIDKSLCNSFSNVIQAVLAVFAKVYALTTMSNFVLACNDGIIENNVEIGNLNLCGQYTS